VAAVPGRRLDDQPLDPKIHDRILPYSRGGRDARGVRERRRRTRTVGTGTGTGTGSVAVGAGCQFTVTVRVWVAVAAILLVAALYRRYLTVPWTVSRGRTETVPALLCLVLVTVVQVRPFHF